MPDTHDERGGDESAADFAHDEPRPTATEVADRMLALCQRRGRASLAHVESLRNLIHEQAEQLAAATTRVESATVLPERWRALIAERDVAVKRVEEAEAEVANLKAYLTAFLPSHGDPAFRERDLRRAARWIEAMAADAAQEARSATETEICARPPHGDDTNHAHDPFAGIEGDDTTEDDRG